MLRRRTDCSFARVATSYLVSCRLSKLLLGRPAIKHLSRLTECQISIHYILAPYQRVSYLTVGLPGTSPFIIPASCRSYENANLVVFTRLSLSNASSNDLTLCVPATNLRDLFISKPLNIRRRAFSTSDLINCRPRRDTRLHDHTFYSDCRCSTMQMCNIDFGVSSMKLNYTNIFATRDIPTPIQNDSE